MSKIFEALENAQADARSGNGRNGTAAPGPDAGDVALARPSACARVHMEEEMVGLRQRLDALLPARTGRAIAFIGSRAGEGTSTVTYEFARVSSARFGQRVLLLEMDARASAEQRFGVVPDDQASGGARLDIAPLPPEFLAAPHAAGSPAAAETWAAFKAAYDLILIDAPPATTSAQGLAVASQVDGVVLVLAAEDTRWPVAERVKQSIDRSGGRVLGVVLNKRQYHIPRWLYGRL
jgi:Mrp family chromosome partitioning ATPase